MTASDGSDVWPDNVVPEDASALEELEAAGVGEGDFDEEGHAVPADVLYAYECLEAAEAGL